MWEKDEKVYNELTLDSYNIYCNGEKVDNISVTDAKEVSYVHKNAQPGYPVYSVAGIFKTTDGLTVESPKSNPVAIAVPDTYALPLFDNFDSQSLETNYWTKQSYYGYQFDTTWGTLPYFGIYDCSLYSSIRTIHLIPADLFHVQWTLHRKTMFRCLLLSTMDY